MIQLEFQNEARLIASARDVAPVKGLTHGFYKYPARFSPQFVRAVIETFTRKGDVVLDPHVGGGTTLVEALALGRHAIGVDISQLAEFISTVKTTVYSESELEELDAWSKRISTAIDIHRPTLRFDDYAEQGYYKHLDHAARWRLRKGIEQGIWSAIRMGTPRLEAFGRCAVLRTAQWALDGRRKQADIDDFREFLGDTQSRWLRGQAPCARPLNPMAPITAK